MSNKTTISLSFLSYSRAEEPAYFLGAPASALAPDFFPIGSGSCFFFKRLWLWLQGAKNTQLQPAPAPQPW